MTGYLFQSLFNTENLKIISFINIDIIENKIGQIEFLSEVKCMRNFIVYNVSSRLHLN